MAAPGVSWEREVSSAKREADQVLCAGKREDGLPLPPPLALAPDLPRQLWSLLLKNRGPPSSFPKCLVLSSWEARSPEPTRGEALSPWAFQMTGQEARTQYGCTRKKRSAPWDG